MQRAINKFKERYLQKVRILIRDLIAGVAITVLAKMKHLFKSISYRQNLTEGVKELSVWRIRLER